MLQLQETELPRFDVADRMRKALRDAHMGVQEMADYLGVGRNTVSAWINGRTPCPPPEMKLFAQRTNVTEEWLKIGPDVHEAGDGTDPRTRAQAGERASTEIVRPIHRRRRDDSAPHTHQYVSQRDYVLSQNVTVESRYARVA